MSTLANYVVPNINMVVPRTMMVKKTFLERCNLKFWITHKEVPTMVPSNSFAPLKDSKAIVCHPALKDAPEEYIEILI